MFPTAVELFAAAILFFFAVIFFGLGAILLWALIAQVVESSVAFYRKHWGAEGAYRRTREYLDAEGRKHFDEAMERLHIEGVNEKPPDEALLQKWREEDEELPGDARPRKRDAGE